MVLIHTVEAIFNPCTEQKHIDIFRRQNPEWIEEATTVSVTFTLQQGTFHDLTKGEE